MARQHVVQQGEHLSSVAAKEGFADFHTILDHPDNSDLAGLRDPHVLFPGDRLALPDREDGEETRATDAVHTFTTDLKPLYLRCKVLDSDGKAVTKAPCKIKIEGEDVPDLVTNDKGIFTQRIGRLDRRAQATVELPVKPEKKDAESTPDSEPANDGVGAADSTLPFTIKIGDLNPETKLSGQQARLNNMGYFAGFTVKDLDQLLWAAEEFVCDDAGGALVPKRPEIEPAPAEGEDEPGSAGPTSKTGIQDAKITARLKKVHGI